MLVEFARYHNGQSLDSLVFHRNSEQIAISGKKLTSYVFLLINRD